MLNMIFRAAVLGAFIAGIACEADAATFDLPRREDGSIVKGLRVEGEIVSGDTQRLLDAYSKYGTHISPLYLRSKGGDVEEAMRMGTIVRRLRLAVSVPVWDTAKTAVDPIKVDRPEDTVCASACFLVYAAGATRFGNYLAMHRPYLAKKDAQTLTDVEYEALQKAIASKVKAYLTDMEVDQYWIDRMFSANSQEQYMPSWAEADNKTRHLMGMVPSLEEVVLSKCTEDPNVDQKLHAFRATHPEPLTPTDVEKIKEIISGADAFFECKENMLSDMQSAAFERENEPSVTAKCGPSLTAPEFSTLKVLLAKGSATTKDEAAKRQILLEKYARDQPCRAEVMGRISMAAVIRWAQEAEKDRPKP